MRSTPASWAFTVILPPQLQILGELIEPPFSTIIEPFKPLEDDKSTCPYVVITPFTTTPLAFISPPAEHCPAWAGTVCPRLSSWCPN